MNYKKKKILLNAIFWPLIIGTVVGINVGNGIAEKNAAIITNYLCPNTNTGGESISQAKESGNQLARQIEREGLAMVKNDNNTLPLAKTVGKVNVFGRGAIEWYWGGSGSGGMRLDNTRVDLVGALREYGIEVNQDLINASRAAVEKEPQKDTLGHPTEECAVISEPGIAKYQSAYEEAKTYSDTAIVALSRYSGEGNDLPKAQYKVNGNPTDYNRTYLDISSEEEELLTQVGKDFKNVIVIINSTTSFNLEFLDRIEGVDSCLLVGVTGIKGALGIPDVMFGDYSPSGHLVDTYTYKWEYNPTYYLTGYEYLGIYQGSDVHRATTGNTRGDIGRNTANYADYEEGIYVGYKWFETADAEGYWDRAPYNGYDNVVQYPFGYGLSYSSFDWEIVTEANKPDDTTYTSPSSNAVITNESDIKVVVKVTNTGDYPAKDVVQVYLTAPYTDGGIEKSYVSLTGFAKTPTIDPGMSTYVTVNIDANEFKSFDYDDKNNNGFSGYELEKGDYVLRLRTDSHHDKEMTGGNTLTYRVTDDIQLANDETTGNPVKPIFSGEDAVDGFAMDGSTCDQNINYFSRASFPELRTKKPADRQWNPALDVSKGGTGAKKYNSYSQEMANAWDNQTGTDAFGNPIPEDKPFFGAGTCEKLYDGSGLTDLGMKLAENYNDSDWETVMDAFTWNECMGIIKESSCTRRAAMPTIGRNNEFSDMDGPSQCGSFMSGGEACTGYPTPTITAMNWNESMYFQMGKSYGNDMIAGGKDGAYGFGANIHHTPFCGRNFEYFSEDGFLSGKAAAQACRGVQVSGRTTFLKHFVLNDAEQWRCGLYTWCTEQAFREIYAKPFEMAVKQGGTTGIMTAFNRIGATWAGGSEAAMQGMVRNEWGFHGAFLTDFGEDMGYMDFAQSIRAGGNYGVSDWYTASCFNSLPEYHTITPRFAHRLREMCKESIYCFIRPLYLNATYNASADEETFIIASPTKKVWVWWKPTMYAVEVLIFGLCAFGGYLLICPPAKKVEETSNKEEN